MANRYLKQLAKSRSTDPKRPDSRRPEGPSTRPGRAVPYRKPALKTATVVRSAYPLLNRAGHVGQAVKLGVELGLALGPEFRANPDWLKDWVFGQTEDVSKKTAPWSLYWSLHSDCPLALSSVTWRNMGSILCQPASQSGGGGNALTVPIPASVSVVFTGEPRVVFGSLRFANDKRWTRLIAGEAPAPGATKGSLAPLPQPAVMAGAKALPWPGTAPKPRPRPRPKPKAKRPGRNPPRGGGRPPMRIPHGIATKAGELMQHLKQVLKVGATGNIDVGSGPPDAKNRPPKKAEKQKKVTTRVSRGLFVVGTIFGTITEGMDFVRSMHAALPAKYRAHSWLQGPDGDWMRVRPSIRKMAEAVYENMSHVDMAAAMQNIINDQIEDFVFGKTAPSAKVNKALGLGRGAASGSMKRNADYASMALAEENAVRKSIGLEPLDPGSVAPQFDFDPETGNLSVTWYDFATQGNLGTRVF